ncbi:mechanosensitive ion channel family protein [Metabacillus sp. GX 13764]|uniref:mechanosensitive ion channel family protein n=1 Tax=Metabacillus kandeliae TaxID=2900151 RepID=UPI001E3D3EF6|nr:mechanosensitive ion channel family protein [Metabacillus kandeliae]MCD7035293.1 mechanosensitive ion channel family protein [Metabacillus kandeliae]
MKGNILDKLTEEAFWIGMGEGLLKIFLILVISSLFIRIGKLAVQKFFVFRDKSPLRVSERRELTMVKLLENILTYVVYFVALMMILETLTINVTSLVAGAGIVGLAIGFGAQNLVRDIITGFFIIFEDQFSVGDYIKVNAFEGTVEEIGLRTTKIKSWTGELHILPNGSISEVTNFSLHNSTAVVDFNVSYESDVTEVERLVEDLLRVLPAKYEDMVSMPELLGVQNFGASEIVMRVVCETAPMRHWYVGRMIRKEIKLMLDGHGIEIPFPRVVMYDKSKEQPEESGEGERSGG